MPAPTLPAGHRMATITDVADDGGEFVARIIRYGPPPDTYGTTWRRGVFAEAVASRYPVLTWGHDWQDPVGRAVDAWETDDGLYMRFRLDNGADVPRARQARAQLKSGTITDVSVDFPLDFQSEPGPGGTREITKAGLYAVGLVVRGSVDGAQVLAGTVRSAGLLNAADRSLLRDLAADLEAGRISLGPALLALDRATRHPTDQPPPIPATEPHPHGDGDPAVPTTPTDDPDHPQHPKGTDPDPRQHEPGQNPATDPAEVAGETTDQTGDTSGDPPAEPTPDPDTPEQTPAGDRPAPTPEEPSPPSVPAGSPADTPGERSASARATRQAGTTVAALAAAADATVDQALDLLAGLDLSACPPQVGQAAALLNAAEVVLDQLLETLGLVDPGDAGDMGDMADVGDMAGAMVATTAERSVPTAAEQARADALARIERAMARR